jgi:hypothetical protein
MDQRNFMSANHLTRCPLCNSPDIKEFYHQKYLPVHVNEIFNTLKEARDCTKGNIVLAVCLNCDLIFNSRFNVALLEYDKNYDNNQGFSDQFQEHINNIINTLIKDYSVTHKKVLEVGCGNGEFLRSLCRASNSNGIGIDPAYRGEKTAGDVVFITDYFDKKYTSIEADTLLLRHVLEHIPGPSTFLADIISTLKIQNDLTVVIEVPDVEWISKHGAYWDLNYEHCNYFSKSSLKSLFAVNNIQAIDISNTFSGQYLIAVGKFKKNPKTELSAKTLNLANKSNTQVFLRNIKTRKHEINSILNGLDSPFAIWGAAGKGVTFINTLEAKLQNKIPYLIDINKNKQDKYCPGTGHRILSPEVLRQPGELRNILIMNPNYHTEIAKMLEKYDKNFSLTDI